MEGSVPTAAGPVVSTEAPKVEGKVDKEKVLSFIEDIIDTLTFKRVALIALLTVIGLGLFSVWENRKAIVDHFTSAKVEVVDPNAVNNWVLSDSSKKSLQTLAKNTTVNFAAVSDVDLKKNRRTVRYYFVDDPTIKLTPEAMQALALPQAVFDYDAKNTEQMVSILSNEFRCDNYKDTIYFRYSPELLPKVPTICRIAIPPFVGQFVGFLTVGIEKQLSKNELDSIRLEVSRIAVEIYLNDVVKKPVALPK